MRVLLDESLPRQLAREIAGHSVVTVRQQGWTSVKNGELLKRAKEQRFDVLVTADQNMQYQQNLELAEIGIVVLVARTNRMQDLVSLVPDLIAAISSVQPGQVVRIMKSD